MMTYNELCERGALTLKTDAIQTGVEKGGWVAALTQTIKSRLPAGYEDEEGFHTEDRPRLHD